MNQATPADAPTPQTILIHQQSPFISVSVPQLQTYYRNRANTSSEYAAVRVSYYDFPAYDDFTEMFGDTLTLTVDALIFGLLYEYAPAVADPYLFTQSLGNSPVTTITDVTEHTATPLILQIATAGITSVTAFAAAVKQELARYALEPAGIVAHGPADLQNMDVAKRCQRILLSHFTDFYFDAALGRLVMELTPAVTGDSLRFISARTAGDQMEYTTVGGFEVTLSALNLPISAAASAAALLGGVVTSAGIARSKFAFESFPAPFPAYDLVPPTRYCMARFQVDAALTTTELVRFTQLTKTYDAVAVNPSRLSTTDYVYIKGAPEMSFFTSNGAAIDVMEVLPRNRPIMGVPSLSDTGPLSYPVYTSLPSLRSMNLTLTDRDGKPIQFGGDYLIKLEIRYY